MLLINELSKTLQQYFKIHKFRSDCLAQIVQAMLLVKTVNFTQIAASFVTDALIDSCYKRIQRFFRFFTFDAKSITEMVMTLFQLRGKKWVLILDRTNWKFGKLDINILMLAVAYKGIAIPLMWSCLPKRGNSNAQERISLIQKSLLLIGAEHIECLTADREFVGKEWIEWLEKHNISYLLRIRNNSLLEGKIRVDKFFKNLSKKRKVKNGKVSLWGKSLYVHTRWSYTKDELVTLISNQKWPDPFKIYRMRWEIETLFGCLKTRGFCFESTHLQDLKRIDKLICVLVIAFCWSHKMGEEKDRKIPIKKKSHGRKAKSLFRYGFDELRTVIRNISKRRYKFLKWIKLLTINQMEAVL